MILLRQMQAMEEQQAEQVEHLSHMQMVRHELESKVNMQEQALEAAQALSQRVQRRENELLLSSSAWHDQEAQKWEEQVASMHHDSSRIHDLVLKLEGEGVVVGGGGSSSSAGGLAGGGL